LRRLIPRSATLVLLVLLSSCSGDDSTPTPDAPAGSEAAYVEELQAITAVLTESLERTNLLIGPTVPRFAPDGIQAQVAFTAMREGAIGGTITEMLAMPERPTPPRRFAEDHAAYLGSLREQASAAVAVDEAVKAEDLPHVQLRTAELNANAATMLVSLSNEFCTLLAPPPSASAGEQDDPTPMLCNGDPLPGGEYGEATIVRHARRVPSRSGDRGTVFAWDECSNLASTRDLTHRPIHGLD